MGEVGLLRRAQGRFIPSVRSETWATRTLADKGSEGVAYAEPGGDEVAGLHPAKDPGDGAEVFHAAGFLRLSLGCGAGVGALGGAGADAGVFELGDRGGLLEIGKGVGGVDDVLAVKGVGGLGKGFQGLLPGGEESAGEVRAVGVCVEGGAGESVERGGDHELEVALGEDDVGVFPVEDFALLGETEGAGEALKRLGEDGAVGWAAAAADGAPAAVEETELDAGVAGRLMEGAVGLEDFPGGGEHAAVFVGVGIAEHDFLGAVPGGEQGLVGGAGPELAADLGGVLEIGNGLKEGDGLKAGVRIFVAQGCCCAFHGDAADPGETDDVEDVGDGGGAGDDVAGERFRRLGALEVGDGAEGFEDFGGLV